MTRETLDMGMQKAIASLVLAILTVLEVATGWKSGINEDWILILLAALNPLLVWAIPNKV
jgi:hypothetical protein